MRAITARPSTVVDTNEAATAGLSPVTFYLLGVVFVGAAAELVAQTDFDVATTGKSDCLLRVFSLPSQSRSRYGPSRFGITVAAAR